MGDAGGLTRKVQAFKVTRQGKAGKASPGGSEKVPETVTNGGNRNEKLGK